MARLLYFPYINVLDSPWLRQSLLYWEGISSIVPLELWEQPESLSKNMQYMVRERIIRPENPGSYIHNIPNFESEFRDYLNANPRTALDTHQPWRYVHLQKLHGIEDVLLEKKLGKKISNRESWLLVEPNTADEFMAYLAACMAATTNNMIAMTDKRRNFSSFFSGNFAQQYQHEAAIQSILPIPSEEIELIEIQRFREKNVDLLWNFRKTIEKGIRDAIRQPLEYRQQAIDDKISDWQEVANLIADKMKQNNWFNIGWGSIAGLGSSGITAHAAFSENLDHLAIAGGLGLFASITSIKEKLDQNRNTDPMAYAAEAWTKFG